MTSKRILLEVGTGNDWHGRDYTKAARRAIEDALHHASLIFLKTLEINPSDMRVEVTIGVQRPEEVDVQALMTEPIQGQVTMNVVKGGLDVLNRGPDDTSVIANAAIVVHIDIDHPVN